MRELSPKEMEAVAGGNIGSMVVAITQHTTGVFKILTMHTGAMLSTIFGMFVPKKP